MMLHIRLVNLTKEKESDLLEMFLALVFMRQKFLIVLRVALYASRINNLGLNFMN